MTDKRGVFSSFEGYSRKELRHALKHADRSILERVLQFLEVDPRTFASGYAKEMMWRYIRRYELDTSHIQRLEHAALNYLERPMRPEYKRMCQTMAHIGTLAFWREVQRHLMSDNPVKQVNAYCLYPYSVGVEAGEKRRLELKTVQREIRMQQRELERYGPYFYGKHVLNAVMNPSLWKDNQVVYHKPAQADAPIFLRGGWEELLELDFSQCDPIKVIDVLNPILVTGKYGDVSAVSAWVYIFYVFGRLRSSEVLPAIQNFYDSRIAHQFESSGKWLTVQAIRRALQDIGTPEAIEALKKYSHADPVEDNHMRSFTKGWLMNEQ
ncbi:MAG: hypothetical protein R3E39_22760 [Anaerolineae bacterium]